MIIASTRYYLYENQGWKDFIITVSAPERSRKGPEFCCPTNVNGELRDVYGIDEMQALILGVCHIQNKLRELVGRGVELYITKNLEQKIDIQLSLLCDFSKYGKAEFAGPFGQI